MSRRLLPLGGPTTLALAVLFTAGCAADSPERAADAATADATVAAATESPVVRVHKDPNCGCCSGWVEHIEEAGFETDVEDTSRLSAIKEELGVPPHLASCHTAVVGDYVIEGHVPADVVQRLLEERPEVEGLAVPGMPVGTPGMEVPGRAPDAYDIIAFGGEGGDYVYESR